MRSTVTPSDRARATQSSMSRVPRPRPWWLFRVQTDPMHATVKETPGATTRLTVKPASATGLPPSTNTRRCSRFSRQSRVGYERPMSRVPCGANTVLDELHERGELVRPCGARPLHHFPFIRASTW